MAENNHPFSVRMDENDKQELLTLIQENGGNAKDFMPLLIQTYKLSKAKTEFPVLSQDITHLESITSQINEIYINMGKRIDSIRQSDSLKFNNELKLYKDKISTLEDAVNLLQEEKTKLGNDLLVVSNENIELNKKLISLEDTIKDKIGLIDQKDKLIDEYKDKNDNLLSMLKDLNESKNKLNAISELLADSQGRNIELTNNIDKLSGEHDLQVKSLNSQIENLQIKLNEKDIQYKKEVTELEKKYENEVNRLKQLYGYEKDKALLDAERIHNEKLSETIEHYTKKIEQIQVNSNAQILEYQKEIKSLLNSNK